MQTVRLRLSKCVLSYQYDTTLTHVSCKGHDTTQKGTTKIFKKKKFFFSKIVQKLFFFENLKTIQYSILCLFVLCCVISYGVVLYDVVSCHVDWIVQCGFPFKLHFFQFLAHCLNVSQISSVLLPFPENQYVLLKPFSFLVLEAKHLKKSFVCSAYKGKIKKKT